MEARINTFATPTGAKFAKYLIGAGRALHEGSVPSATLHLVDIRASQINGCGFCLDMHTKDATAAGETAERLNLVAAWREAGCFTDAERAALELAEAGTRLADGTGVSDEVWENAAKHYDEDQLATLVGQIALINAFNRGNILVKQPAGDYVAGQFDALK
ncbi:AhpD family alkylhydroperoxidase [Catenulispora sp. MAP12-49]|uniref:carboxymuconolactone decarboxylase family protein n=1 Tax=unclassified Catenulispora TaxID=414885 RepID=UPI00351788B0